MIVQDREAVENAFLNAVDKEELLRDGFEGVSNLSDAQLIEPLSDEVIKRLTNDGAIKQRGRSRCTITFESSRHPSELDEEHKIIRELDQTTMLRILHANAQAISDD